MCFKQPVSVDPCIIILKQKLSDWWVGQGGTQVSYQQLESQAVGYILCF